MSTYFHGYPAHITHSEYVQRPTYRETFLAQRHAFRVHRRRGYTGNSFIVNCMENPQEPWVHDAVVEYQDRGAIHAHMMVHPVGFYVARYAAAENTAANPQE